MQYKDFPLNAKNCTASLEVSDEELRASGMINAKIDIDTKSSDFSKDLSIGLRPKLETMLFDTCNQQGKLADGFFSYVTGDGRKLIISPLNQQVKANRLVIYCKVNN